MVTVDAARAAPTATSMEPSVDHNGCSEKTEQDLVPAGWDVRPLLSSARIASGQVDPRIEPYRSMILIAPDHIESGSGRLLTKITAADQRAVSGKYFVRAGDIIYSKIRPNLQKAARVDFDCLCSADMYPLTPVKGFSGGFIAAVLLSERFTNFAVSVSARSGMPKINRTELSQYFCAFPLHEHEQHAIAGALADADALVETLEMLIEKNRAIKQGMMESLFTGEIRLPGFTTSWRYTSIGEHYDFKNGLNKEKKYFGYGTPIINYMDVFHNNCITKSDVCGLVSLTPAERENFSARRGDIFFTRTSETSDEIGMSAALVDDLPNGVFSGFLLRARPKSVDIDPTFAAYLFRSPLVRRQIISKASYTTRALTNGRQLSAVAFKLPCKDEQRAIVNSVLDLDRELSELVLRKKKTKMLKAGMTQVLLTGSVRLA
ncbi:hypothetical protein [Mesorhizobium sp. CA12]|uniref:restriction endonuclease subunit S n=1 Tax=Mesorhizobium sp. CA12 TaxID=2876644 RepID=UPI001CCF9799|nr:hypothetical protein [Mesorhizobium sp. CA12]MBZ9859700.1 hypothetical protein [Mesorhizobium sp. CA12]